MLGPLQNPVGAQIGPQIDQVAPQTCLFRLRAVAFSQSRLFVHMLVALWFSVGTLLVPIGYILLHFRYHFQ